MSMHRAGTDRVGLLPAVAGTFAVVVAVALVGPALARAWTSPNLGPDVDVVLFAGDGGAVRPMDIEGFRPGSSESRRFVLALHRYSLSARPLLGFANVADFEQGCNEPERASGDSSCGDAPGQGELSGELQVMVRAARAVTLPASNAVCPADPVWAVTPGKSLADYAATPLRLLSGGTLAAGEGLCLEITFSLPEEADNLVQNDRVRFDITFSGEQDTLANREIKELATRRLADAVPTGDSTLDRVIPKAIERIQASLAPELWVDDTHLSEHGKKVYDRERQAAHELLKGYLPHEAVADVQAWLVGVDARIAAAAIADAQAASARSDAARAGASRKAAAAASTSLAQAATELQRANAAMAAGDADVAAGEYDRAVTDFREARSRGERALSLALEALALLR